MEFHYLKFKEKAIQGEILDFPTVGGFSNFLGASHSTPVDYLLAYFSASSCPWVLLFHLVYSGEFPLVILQLGFSASSNQSGMQFLLADARPVENLPYSSTSSSRGCATR